MLYDHDELHISVVTVSDIEWSRRSIKVKRRPYSALSYRVRGSGILKTEEQTVAVNEGDVLFLPEGIDYEADYTEGEILVIHFECKNALFDRLENYSLTDGRSVLPLFRRACHAWQNKRVGYKLEITALFYEILLAIRRQMLESEGMASAFGKAVDIMKNEYKNPLLTVNSVCEQAGISDSYFRRSFRKSHGMHPHDYLTELRLTNAETLLHMPSYSVERAALESGFSDPKYFARVVKKLRGCSPSELRFI